MLPVPLQDSSHVSTITKTRGFGKSGEKMGKDVGVPVDSGLLLNGTGGVLRESSPSSCPLLIDDIDLEPPPLTDGS